MSLDSSLAPRVVLVHDWLTGMRGGEKVLLELCRLFPEAPVYTLLRNRGTIDVEIERRVAAESFLAKLPGARRGYRNYLPLFPAAVRSLRLPPADLVVSTSHAVAHAVRVPPGAVHVSYIHTPMRYAWGFAPGPGDPLRRFALAAVRPALKSFDRRAAQRVDHLVANSRNVAGRIRQVWSREAEVIYPPVDVDFFRPDPEVVREEFYLVAGSLEPSKLVDLALAATARLGRPLVVAGDGTQARSLRTRAGEDARFLGRVTDEELRSLYRRCRALLLPGEEDFGIVPVEAQACGAPVIAYRAGGALETVRDGATGGFFGEQTPESLADAIEQSERVDWDRRAIRAHAETFSRAAFRDKMGEFSRRLGPNLDRAIVSPAS